MKDLLDTTDLKKEIAESEAAWKEENNNDPNQSNDLNQEEATPDDNIEDEHVENNEELTENNEELENHEDEERPKTSKGWKAHRENVKNLKQEARKQAELAEKQTREVIELRERLARLEGREEAREKPVIENVNQDPEPDRDIDPEEHLRWELRKTKKEVEEIKRAAEEARQYAQLESARRGLEKVEKEYVRTQKIKDYDDAIEYVKNVEGRLIKLQHPHATEEQINTHLEAEKLRLAREQYAKGENPAKFFYDMAKALGYNGTASNNAKDNTLPNINAIKRNMEKNTNLIGSSSVEKTGGVPPEKLLKMSIAELLKDDSALRREIKRQEMEHI